MPNTTVGRSINPHSKNIIHIITLIQTIIHLWNHWRAVKSMFLERLKYWLGIAVKVRQGFVQTRQSLPADTFAGLGLLHTIGNKQAERFGVNVVSLLQFSNRRMVGEGDAWHRRSGGQQPLSQTKQNPNTPLWGVSVGTDNAKVDPSNGAKKLTRQRKLMTIH